MLFRQLFEPDSSTYTYLIHCRDSGKTLLIDPVLKTVERDLALLQELGLTLDYTLDTHVHADHLTGAKKLKQLTQCQIAWPALDGLPCVDIGVREGQPLQVGNIAVQPLFTPGHTDHHHAYLIEHGGMTLLFSGDALLIDACGRTDFQSGDAATLYRSIHNKFFTLPDETLVYPCHDYEGRCVSSIGQEKIRNPRVGRNKSQQEFIDIMHKMDLPYPRKMAFAVPGNQLCGECPADIPGEPLGPCPFHDQG